MEKDELPDAKRQMLVEPRDETLIHIPLLKSIAEHVEKKRPLLSLSEDAIEVITHHLIDSKYIMALWLTGSRTLQRHLSKFVKSCNIHLKPFNPVICLFSNLHRLEIVTTTCSFASHVCKARQLGHLDLSHMSQLQSFKALAPMSADVSLVAIVSRLPPSITSLHFGCICVKGNARIDGNLFSRFTHLKDLHLSPFAGNLLGRVHSDEITQETLKLNNAGNLPQSLTCLTVIGDLDFQVSSNLPDNVSSLTVDTLFGDAIALSKSLSYLCVRRRLEVITWKDMVFSNPLTLCVSTLVLFFRPELPSDVKTVIVFQTPREETVDKFHYETIFPNVTALRFEDANLHHHLPSHHLYPATLQALELPDISLGYPEINHSVPSTITFLKVGDLQFNARRAKDLFDKYGVLNRLERLECNELCISPATRRVMESLQVGKRTPLVIVEHCK